MSIVDFLLLVPYLKNISMLRETIIVTEKYSFINNVLFNIRKICIPKQLFYSEQTYQHSNGLTEQGEKVGQSINELNSLISVNRIDS